MNIGLVGYGRMGHIIEDCAKRLGHTVVVTVDPVASDATVKLSAENIDKMAKAVFDSGAQAVIEFSHPSAVIANLKALIPTKIPLIVGTTGWSDKESEIATFAKERGGVVLASSNYSIGVYIFTKIVREAAKLFAPYPDYDCAINEIHHNQKADSPSGTALTLAKAVMEGLPTKTQVVTDAFQKKPQQNELHVSSTRVGSVPGTHSVYFDSIADTITLTHTARSREGFALGAVRAAELLTQKLKKGELLSGALYHLEDVLG